MPIMKPKKLSTLLVVYLLVSISILTFGILSWTWRTTTRAVDEKLKESFEQRQIIGENILEREMERIESALHEIQLNKALLSDLSTGSRERALDALLMYEEMDARNRLDILFISSTRGLVWLDASSPIPDSSSILPDVAVRRREFLSTGKMLRFANDSEDLTVMLKSMRLVLDDGEILGVLVGGVVLNDNFPLVDKIRKKSKTDVILLMEGDAVIASAGSRKIKAMAELAKVHALKEVHRRGDNHPLHLGGVFASYCTIHLAGERTTTKIVMAIDDAVLVKLQQTYRNTGLFLAVSFIGFLLLTLFIIRQLTFPSLERLLNCTSAISEGNLENTFAPGSVIELNQLGMSLENMASSIHQAQVSLK
ncbi:MAG: hypothetical protein GY859_07760, partial [Desulfobacterales bacterium]|nr:hypothetical protein [Desulfobacterales bacterium]